MHVNQSNRWGSIVGTAALIFGLIHPVEAIAYPDKPVKIIVGFAAGGPTDLIARVIAQELSATMGQPFTVDNRPGGTASVATDAVAVAPADGHTLLFSSVQLMINPILTPTRTADPFKTFAPISNVASLPLVVITARLAARARRSEAANWTCCAGVRPVSQRTPRLGK